MSRQNSNPPCPKCGESLSRNGKTPAGKQRWRCGGSGRNTKGCGYSTTDPSAPARDQKGEATDEDLKNPQYRRKLSGIKRFVITAAQNATPVHMEFLKSLRQYCAHNDAELVVIPIRYKNPTSRWTDSQANREHWLRDVAEQDLAEMGVNAGNFEKYYPDRTWGRLLDEIASSYLYNQRKKLCENLVLLGDIKTVPTADRPLSQFEAITHGESGILGHTKLQLTTIPTPQGMYPKVMTTTGALTVPNYTDSKSGKKGEFHHTLGAVAVDIVGTKFFIRQINADKRNGDFIDLEYWYTPDEVLDAGPALALVMGDTHRAFIDSKVEAATFGKGGIVEALDPKMLVFHDLHDGYAENPHHINDAFSALAKRKYSMDHIETEIREDVEWLEKVVGKTRTGVIVASNHDNFLSRWIRTTDWRKDPVNAEFYLETALAMARSTEMTNHGASVMDPFTWWVGRLKKDDIDIRTPGASDSFMVADIELGMHGDRGPNGARGTRMNLRRIGVKSIIGHSHSPGIEEGCYQVGTSSPLRLEYNSGPSSWLNTHCVVYANGKRCLLNIIDGQWRF